MSSDLHCHTDTSPDSQISFSERLNLAEKHGIDNIALTDHNFVHPRLKRREENFGDVNVVSGVELSCFGEEGEVHILGFFIEPESMREKLHKRYRLKYRHGIRSIHDAGGVAVLAHPGRYDTNVSELVEKLVDMRLDGLETEYPYQVHKFEDYSIDAVEVAEKHGLLTSGGSNCHGGRRETMGKIKVEDKKLVELRDAAGKYR